MNVTYDLNGISVKDLLELVEDLGYEPVEWETNDANKEKETVIGEREVQIEFSGINNRYALLLLLLLLFYKLNSPFPQRKCRYP